MTRQLVEIGSLGTVVTGDTPPKKNPEYYGSAYPFIKPTDMRVGQRYTYAYEECYSEAAYEKYRKKLIPEGATAVVTIGSIGQKLTLTHTACFVNQAVNAVIPNNEEFNSLYVFYLLKHNLNLVKSADTGASSGRENVSKSNFSKLQVLATLDIKEQERIASILDGYDSLIENNQRRIALLEESARLLYREWFVNMRYPGHELQSFTNGLPNGWQRVRLDDALLLQRGFDLPTQSRREGDVPIYSSTGITAFHNESKVVGPGVVTGRSGTLGDVHFVHDDYWPLNTALWVKEFRAVTPFFAYFLLSEMNLAQFNSGASVPTLDRKVAHAQPIVLPTMDVMHQFGGYIEPILQQVRKLQQGIAAAKQARNGLLPKLMSGEIQV